MAKILFEMIGPNYQVPGLPYEQTFKYVRPVVFDTIPSFDEIKELLAGSDQDTLSNPWCIDVIKGFRDYIPTTFRRITHRMPSELLEKYFDIGEHWIPEAERVLLQLQTEIDSKAATIDAAIINSRREIGTVVNKAHLANRLYMIGRLYNHLEEREYPLQFGDLTKEENWDDALSRMKMTFIDYMLEVPVGRRKYPRRMRKVEVSPKELSAKYPYVEWLKEKLGDSLVGVLLYGSAARTDNPEEYSDFDNWVRVRDVRKAHQALKGTKPYVIDGKVVEWGGKDDADLPEGAKHIGIHLMPDSEDYLVRHIRFLHDSREFLKHTKVLFGDFMFPKIRQDEVIERGISQAYVKLKTIAGSLNWAYSTPEKIYGKPNLFEYIVKNVRFFKQHSLNVLKEPRFRDKKVLDQLLAEQGMIIPKYEPDHQHIKDSIIVSMINVMRLQKELIDSGRKPHLEFLVDNKSYEWTSEEIEDWGKFDDE
jgi:predicted nucleotidyltransferase